MSLEQHGFELHRSIYTRFFFFNKYTIGPPYTRVLHSQIQPTAGGSETVLLICSWEHVDVEG